MPASPIKLKNSFSDPELNGEVARALSPAVTVAY